MKPEVATVAMVEKEGCQIRELKKSKNGGGHNYYLRESVHSVLKCEKHDIYEPKYKRNPVVVTYPTKGLEERGDNILESKRHPHQNMTLKKALLWQSVKAI